MNNEDNIGEKTVPDTTLPVSVAPMASKEQENYLPSIIVCGLIMLMVFGMMMFIDSNVLRDEPFSNIQNTLASTTTTPVVEPSNLTPILTQGPVGISNITFLGLEKSEREYPRRELYDYAATAIDGVKIGGTFHNVFVGRIMGQNGSTMIPVQIGTTTGLIPSAEFMVDVQSNIQGSLEGRVTVAMPGGCIDGHCVTVFAGNPSSITVPGTYIFATRYDETEHWHLILAPMVEMKESSTTAIKATTTTSVSPKQVSQDVKSADTTIKSDLANIRAHAEIYYDKQNPNSYGEVFSAAVCPTTGSSMFFADTQIRNLLKNIVTVSGRGQSSTRCASNGTDYAISAGLVFDLTTFWCIDSTGVAKVVHIGDWTGVRCPQI